MMSESQGRGARGEGRGNCGLRIADCELKTRPSFPIPQRILVLRLDRLGDVILSTPILDALRHAYPEAFIAMMVRPSCRDVVEGHPSLNSVILYDKAKAHRRVGDTIRFAWQLRRFRFDTAIVLHPTYRSHGIVWLAGVPVRIGYARKGGWLLTHRLPHRKQEGKKHESLYALDVLEPLGIRGWIPRPRITISSDAKHRLNVRLAAASLTSTDRLVAIHPSASCISKRWMPERFAQVADRLIQEERVQVCLVAGEEDRPYARALMRAMAMRQGVHNFAGELSVGELAALFCRCRLLISNDSGPVHIAAAVGTPVVDIFGRNQQGLSPKRWGPIGEGHLILHKEVGCVNCLAHACDINFLCLTALSVDEVYDAALSILHRPQPLTGKRC